MKERKTIIMDNEWWAKVDAAMKKYGTNRSAAVRLLLAERDELEKEAKELRKQITLAVTTSE